MKILFIADEENFQFLTTIETLLKTRSKAQLKFDIHTAIAVDVKMEFIQNFDILIVAGYLTSISVSEVNKPIIYLSNGQNFISDSFLLDKIILIGPNVNFKSWFGIEKEKLIHAPLNLYINNYRENLKRKVRKEIKKIAYIPNGDSDSFINSRIVMSALNGLLNYKITVFINRNGRSILESIANANIRFEEDSNARNLLGQFDLIIGDKNTANAAIIERVPLFVLGRCGLGGLVTSSNIKDFMRTEFNGRIGGVPEEEIPLELLKLMLTDAISKVNDLMKMGSNTIEDTIIDSLIDFRNDSCLDKILKEIRDTYQRFSTLSQGSLIHYKMIKVLTSVLIQDDNNEGCIVSSYETGQVLAILGADEFSILKTCINGIHIQDLYSRFPEYSSQEIDTLVNEFFENQIVRYYN